MLLELTDTLNCFHQYCAIFLVHYHAAIQAFGAPNGLCSSITESKHIDAVKNPYWCSNCHKALGQMLLTNQCLDKLEAAYVDFTVHGMLEGTCLSEALKTIGEWLALLWLIFSEFLFTDQGANPNVDLHHGDDLDSDNEEVDPNSEVLAHVELARSVHEFEIMGTQESDPNLVCHQNRKPLLQLSHFKSINLPFQNLFIWSAISWLSSHID